MSDRRGRNSDISGALGLKSTGTSILKNRSATVSSVFIASHVSRVWESDFSARGLPAGWQPAPSRRGSRSSPKDPPPRQRCPAEARTLVGPAGDLAVDESECITSVVRWEGLQADLRDEVETASRVGPTHCPPISTVTPLLNTPPQLRPATRPRGSSTRQRCQPRRVLVPRSIRRVPPRRSRHR